MVEFEPSLLAYQAAQGQPIASAAQLPRRDVVRFDAAVGEIELTPLIIYPPKNRFLKPRFDQIRTVLFEGYEFRLPRDADDVAQALEVLPEGFYRRPEFGLGLPTVLLPLIKQVERLPKVTRLVISKTRQAAHDGQTVILGHDEVERALAFLKKVSERHQRRSLQERNTHVRNHLITPLDPAAFPEERPPYSDDTIFEALNVVRESKLKLSPADQDALVSEVGKRVDDLKRDAPDKLFKLHRQIELVNLDMLIQRFEALLALPHKAEKRWQNLFDLNPFILSMIFGYPVVKVLREATVGAPLLDGRGAKIADFLTKNPTTSNAALVELKTPQAGLLTATPYRGSDKDNPVYPPHAELSGAVAQVLDQRRRLQKDIATIQSNNRGVDIEAYHVDCVVVAGLMPKDGFRKEAFETYRRSHGDVRIVTFDELLIKLHSLRDFLAALPAAGDGDDDLDNELDDQVQERGLDDDEGIEEVGAINPAPRAE